MCQEVEHPSSAVTSMQGSAQQFYEEVYCKRGQMENLIKLHKSPARVRIAIVSRRDG